MIETGKARALEQRFARFIVPKLEQSGKLNRTLTESRLVEARWD